MKAYIVLSMSDKVDPVFNRIIQGLEEMSVVIELDPNKVSLGRISDMRKETSDAQE